MNKYEELGQKLKEIRKEKQKVMKEVFKQGSVELFKENPLLENFGWNQYTPYFNDGDVCSFGVYNDNPRINEKSADEIEWVGYKWELGKNGEYGKKVEVGEKSPLISLIEPVCNFLKIFDNEDYLEMFGDHVQVTIHKDGRTEIDSYEHD